MMRRVCAPIVRAGWGTSRASSRFASANVNEVQAMINDKREREVAGSSIARKVRAGEVKIVKLLGVVESIHIDTHQWGVEPPVWRHYYTVNGHTAVHYVKHEWLSTRAEVGIAEGSRVCMNCKVIPDGSLIMTNIRPAKSVELVEINRKDENRLERNIRKHRELNLRGNVIQRICSSRLATNLDLEAFKLTSEAVYKFIKEGSQPKGGNPKSRSKSK